MYILKMKDDNLNYISINNFIKLSEKDKIKFSKLYFSCEDIDKLNDEDFKNFCDGIAQCFNLQDLALESLNLVNLKLARLQILLGALTKCKHIQKLDLSHNEIKPPFSKVFFIALTELTNLQNLNLSFNNLNSWEEEQCSFFAQYLPECKNLKKLNLSNNNFQALILSRFKQILGTIKQCKNLQELSLIRISFQEFEAEQCNIFCKLITECKHLVKLKLGNTVDIELGTNQFMALCQIIAATKNLHEFKLPGLNMRKLGSKERMAFCVAIAERKTLQKLSLSFCNFKDWEDAEFIKFCDTIAGSSLKELDFHGANIYELNKTKIQLLYNAIITNHNLEVVLLLKPNEDEQIKKLIYLEISKILEQKKEANNALSKLPPSREIMKNEHQKNSLILTSAKHVPISDVNNLPDELRIPIQEYHRLYPKPKLSEDLKKSIEDHRKKPKQ